MGMMCHELPSYDFMRLLDLQLRDTRLENADLVPPSQATSWSHWLLGSPGKDQHEDPGAYHTFYLFIHSSDADT